MPLLVSPIDGVTPMQQLKRDGIEIDRCPVSGGVWLDKGELEKLLMAVQEARQEERYEYSEYQRQAPGTQRAGEQYSSQRYRDDDGYEDFYRKKYGKKSKMKSFFDLFDFD